MATLAFDHATQTPSSAAADLPTSDALMQVAVAFLDAGLVQSSAQLFAMAATAGADRDIADAGRRRALQISTTDESIAARTARGGTIMLPSAERTDDGMPRFILPLGADVAGQPEVMQVIAAELTGDGVDAELRNFLGAFLESGDVFVDCDPGFGFASLSAATSALHDISVIARAADADHADFLQHAFTNNGPLPAVVEGPRASGPQSLTSLLSQRAATQASRVVIYAGTADDLDAMRGELAAAMRDRRVAAIAWTLGTDDASTDLGAHLESLGGAHFVVAADDEGVLLVPEGQVIGSSLIVTIPEHTLADRQAA